MTYTTVFDASHPQFTTWFFPAALGFTFVAVGALLLFRPAMMDKALPGGLQGRSREVFRYVFFGFAILWTLGICETMYLHYRSAIIDLNSGRYSVVTGRVTAYSAWLKQERFCVDTACFSYSDYIVTGGFNNMASHGGPIHEGLRVRIEYIGNLILKLQIDQSDQSNP